MNFKTSYGSAFKISNGTYLEFEEKKIKLKKIWEIGDNLIINDIKTDKQLMNISWVVAGTTFVIGIYLLFNPYIAWEDVYYEGRSLAEVSRIPDLINWIVFIISLACGVLFTNTVNKLNNIDFDKNNYPLTILVILVDNPDPMKRETARYELCKGNINELREIRRVLLDKITEQRQL